MNLDGTFLDRLDDLIIAFIQHNILFTPLLLFLEEAGIPLPAPGDIFIAYTGYQVSKGIIPYPFAFLLLLVATLAGSSILYYLSSRWGQLIVLRFGKYIHLDEKKLIIVEEKFRKYGPLVIIIGRHIPGFRVPITFFAGVSDITYKTFIISTLFSIILWIPFYLSVGQRLGPKTLALFHHNQAYFLIFLIPLAIFICSAIFLRVKQRRHLKKIAHQKTDKSKV